MTDDEDIDDVAVDDPKEVAVLSRDRNVPNSFRSETSCISADLAFL